MHRHPTILNVFKALGHICRMPEKREGRKWKRKQPKKSWIRYIIEYLHRVRIKN